MVRSIFKKDYRGYIVPPKRTELVENLKYSNQRDRDAIRKKLRIDFQDKCAYCGGVFGGYGSEQFHIEHIKCKEIYKELIDDYNNFAFSCPICNHTKGKKSMEIEVDLDPTLDDFKDYFYRNKYGAIVVNKFLSEEKFEIAQKFIRLYGLSKEIHKIDYLYESLTYILKKSIEDKDVDLIIKILNFQEFIKKNFIRKTVYK